MDLSFAGTFIEFDQRESFWLGETRLLAEYAFADGWGVGTLWPLRTVRSEVMEAESLHLSETRVGLGDPWLIVRHTRAFGPWSIDLSAGTTVPLGGTEENPFRLEAEGRVHRHFQFGTGTWSPLATARLERNLGPLSAAFWGATVLSVHESSRGYRPGNRYAAGLAAISGLGTNAWRFRLGVEASIERAERWDGVRRETAGNTGRTDLLAAGGAIWSFADEWSLLGSVRVPFHTEVVGGGLEIPIIAEIGLRRVIALGGEGREHEHGDEHGDEHDHDGEAESVDFAELDVVEVAPNGEAVDLVPVRGKVTVFNFWATWCEPCRELDAGIADLMRRYPDRIAVRKLHVETWETPAARRYLGRAPALPHVVVFGPDGERAFEQSGAPESILESIEDLLR